MTAPDRSAPPSNQIRAVRIQAKCPVCGKPADAKYQPFCTKRCADIDLGRWLKEGYRVPTDEGPGEEDTPPSQPIRPRPTGQQR